MDMFLAFLYAFLVGGTICAIGQLIILKTKITPTRVLVLFVSIGVLLGAAQAFAPMRETVGAGITVPIVGFGGLLAEGVIKAVREDGFIGIFTGGITATAAGIAVAITIALLVALVARSKSKQ